MLTRSASYPDRETAHWATQQVVTANEQVIHRWLAQGTRARLTIEAAWPSREEPVGRVRLEGDLLAGRGPSTFARRASFCAASRRARTASSSTRPSRSTCRGRTHMSMKPLEHDRRHGELDQVMRAYLGQPADDSPEGRSRALTAYLRHTWHTRPWAIAEAERQLREYSRNPPGRFRQMLREFYSIPDTGTAESEIGDWLMMLADHLKKSIEEGDVPEPSSPQTHWEWHARFPETAQLLGGWFSQDIVDEFPDHDAAVADYAATTDPHLVARLVGELHELLALPLDEGEYALAAAELGMEVGPPEPFSYGAWFQAVAATLSG